VYAVPDFSPGLLAPAVAARAATWTRFGLAWQTGPVSSQPGGPTATSTFESPDWVADITVWATGETELATVRLTDDRMVNKHYDLTGPGDLEVLLDDWEALLHTGRVPPAAVVTRWPGAPR
jgi:hypothetical protein